MAKSIGLMAIADPTTAARANRFRRVMRAPPRTAPVLRTRARAVSVALTGARPTRSRSSEGSG